MNSKLLFTFGVVTESSKLLFIRLPYHVCTVIMILFIGNCWINSKVKFYFFQYACNKKWRVEG